MGFPWWSLESLGKPKSMGLPGGQGLPYLQEKRKRRSSLHPCTGGPAVGIGLC